MGTIKSLLPYNKLGCHLMKKDKSEIDAFEINLKFDSYQLVCNQLEDLVIRGQALMNHDFSLSTE